MSTDSPPVLTVTPAAPTKSVSKDMDNSEVGTSSSNNVPATDKKPPSDKDMQSLLDEFDPLTVKDKTKTKEESRKVDNVKQTEEPVEQFNEKSQSQTTAAKQSDSDHVVIDDEPQELPFDFQRFLNQLRHRSADPIARYLKSFLSEFSKRPWSTQEQVKFISDFKEFIAVKMQKCAPFSALNEHEMNNAMEGMEKLIMNRLYAQTFSAAIPDADRSDDHEEDIIRDGVLEEKMRIWHWIEGRHLDLADRFLRNGEAFVKLSSDELLKINHYRAPRDKIICILNCCKVIFGLLRQTDTEESADAFLPILIYVVIKAQPESLISNVNYIQRFRNPDKLGGEAGYYLSSLLGAVNFIETLDRKALSITDEEFEKNVEHSVRSINAPARRSLQANLHQPPHTPERHISPNRDQSVSPGLNASSVLMSSAGLLSAPLRSLGKFFETDDSRTNNESPRQADEGTDPGDTNKPDTTTAQTPTDPDAKTKGLNNFPGMTPHESAARQISAEEEEARRIHRQEFESVSDTLAQMFPSLDREIIQDVLRQKDGRVGAAVDACLVLVGSS